MKKALNIATNQCKKERLHTLPKCFLPRCFIRVEPVVLTMLMASGTVLVQGCSNAKEPFSDVDSSYEETANQTAVEVAELDELAATAETPPQAKNGQEVENISGDSEITLGSQVADINPLGKELVITANASFKVDDVVESVDTIESLTQEQGGYVALSNISNSPHASRTFTQGDKDITLTTYYREGRMTVRIPRKNVNQFMTQVQEQVRFLEYQEFKAQDVTLDIYREKLAEQLNDSMASELKKERLESSNEKEQGSNVDSIVATYDAKRRKQLAKLQQMDINDRVKFSTIELTFSQPNVVYKQTTPNLDSAIEEYEPSFISQVGDAFVSGWEMLRTAIITIIGLWWLLPVIFVLYLIFKLIRFLYRLLFKRIKSVKK